MFNSAIPVIAIHGGAGTILRVNITVEQQRCFREVLHNILLVGQAMLAKGSSAVEVVTEAVRLFEECPLFNAGQGAVYTSDEHHELDASVMRGSDLAAGAVAGVRRLRNPVLTAKLLMESGGPVMLIGEGAESFAKARDMELVSPDWFDTPHRLAQLRSVQSSQSTTALLDHDAQNMFAAPRPAPLDERSKFGTVGAVALDGYGNLAAATSTGGMTNKLPGRVGDSPVIGAGTYADNQTAAVSCTGVGEAFIRAAVAHDVCAMMAYGGLSLQAATRRVVMEKLPPLGGNGGLIAVDAKGNVSLTFNTEGMYRGWARVGEKIHCAIYADEDDGLSSVC